jgi:hypothetical protein
MNLSGTAVFLAQGAEHHFPAAVDRQLHQKYILHTHTNLLCQEDRPDVRAVTHMHGIRKHTHTHTHTQASYTSKPNLAQLLRPSLLLLRTASCCTRLADGYSTARVDVFLQAITEELHRV